IKLGITWIPANNAFVNNILAAPKGGSLGQVLQTQDHDNPVDDDATTMIVGMDYDLFTRPVVTKPRGLVSFIHVAAPTSLYTSMPAFAIFTCYEAHRNELTGSTPPPS